MGKIFLVMDYSANAGLVYSSLACSSTLLESEGYDFAPFDTDNHNLTIPINIRSWLNYDGGELSCSAKKKLENIKSSLHKGRNIIFLGMAYDLPLQKNLYNFIQRNLDVANNKVVTVNIIGKPSLLLEQFLLGNRSATNISDMNRYMDLASHLTRNIYFTIDTWGKQDTHLIADLFDLSNCAGVEFLCQKVFDILGTGGTPTVAEPLPFYGFACTATGKRLFEARKVHDNDWPRLNNFAYISKLREVEKSWFPEPESPLKYRREFLQKGREEENRLEKLLGVEKGALAAPDWFGKVEGKAHDEPLKNEKIVDFAEALPKSERHVLLERYNNDKQFLTDDQKLFAQVLAVLDGKDFAHMDVKGPAPLLTVLTMTRNQEKYIGECIESVLAQETDFPVQHIVLDHYSTDATPDIVNRYARDYSSIRPVLLKDYHQICNNVRELLGRCRSEYAALCDGDDYFTSKHKLQKQVDFLRDNSNCSLVFHPVEVKFEDRKESFFFPPIEKLPRGVKSGYYLSDLIKGNFIQTNSVVYRWRFRDGLPEWFRADVCPGDWYWHLLHAELGKIGFIREVMSVYRRHSGAAYSDAFLRPTEHFLKVGMKTLEAYKIYNDHFKGCYFPEFCNLASEILYYFVKNIEKDGDTSLLDEAVIKFPEFSRHFLNSIKQITPDKARQESCSSQ